MDEVRIAENWRKKVFRSYQPTRMQLLWRKKQTADSHEAIPLHPMTVPR